MIDIPLSTIKTKIKESTKLTDEELQAKIRKKLDELSGLISEEGAARIIANELGVKLVETNGVVTIDKVLAGMRNIELVGKVRQVYEVREFSTEKRKGKVGSFLLADTTGVIRVVLWNDKADNLAKIKAGDIVKLKGANARDNNGRTEIHCGDMTNLYINPEGITVDVDISAPMQRPEAAVKKIADFVDTDQNVSVIATIVQVFDPRFFPVCPECNTRAKEEEGFSCPTHGTITPQYNYVMNLYLDDGSDNIRCVLWREQVDALLGETREQVVKYKDDPTSFENHKTDLLGMIVKVRGRVNKNETFGRLELVAYEVEKNVNPPETEEPEPEVEETKETAAPETPAAAPEPVPKAPVEKPSVEPEPASQPEPMPVQPGKKDDVLTLDDIEDLEDLDD